MLLFTIDFNAVTTIILEALTHLKSLRHVLGIKYDMQFTVLQTARNNLYF